MLSRLSRKYNILGNLLAALSIAWLFGVALNHGWAAPFAYIFKVYNVLKVAIFSPFEPYIESIVKGFLTWLPNDWHLQRHWHDIVVIMSLYFGARAGSYLKSGLKGRAAFRYVFGVSLSVVTAVFSGLVITSSAATNALLAAIPIFGILAFKIVDSAISATVARQVGLTWVSDWMRYLNFSLPILAIGLIGILSACWIFHGSEEAQTNSLGLFCLLGFSFALAAYWAFRGYLFARPVENRLPGEGVWMRFKRSSNTEIALSMGVALGLALLILSSSAGYEAVAAIL